MADKVELKSAPPEAPAGTKVPEAVIQPSHGDTKKVTVDTTQPPPKPEEKAPERPAWLPEEFKSPEDFAEAWKAQKTKAEPKADPKPNETPDPQKTEAAVEKAGLDMQALSAEYAKDGKLSDESLSKLEKAGITRQMVDAYVEGQKAQAQAYVSKVAESVGGQDALQATLKWAETALSADEIAAANKALQSGDATQASLVVAGLNSRRIAEVGIEPKLTGGRAAPGRGDVQGYESTQQMITDMNSKLYKSDPAFREVVMKRIAASKF